MIVVSDTTAITSLLAIGRVDLLEGLFTELLIPPAVEAELRAGHDGLPAFLEVTPLKRPLRGRPALGRLGSGEREAIALAVELKADLLVMDERKGRREAQELGVAYVGLLGLLVAAKRRGLLDSVGGALTELKVRAGFYITEALREEVLRRAGE